MSTHTTKQELTGMVGRAVDYQQIDIFNLPPASRRNDRITSKLAGKRAEDRCSDGKLSKLHIQVLEAFRINGPMNDETLERLPVFARYAASTVRKRRGELSNCTPPMIVEYGLMTNSNGSPMTIWAIDERVTNTPSDGVPVMKPKGTGETGVGPACAIPPPATAAEAVPRAARAAAGMARALPEEA